MTAQTWQDFVIAYGWRARAYHLAVVLGEPEAEIQDLRRRGVCRRGTRREFHDLFTLRHGRPPRDDEWPAPRRIGAGYEWLTPELSLLVSLVGRVGPQEISRLLTARLRRLTGDPRAARDRNAVQVGVARSGLQFGDVVGGVTVAQAAREIGTRSIIDHYIRKGRLAVQRIGRYYVIPHDAWAAWKASRVFPPAAYVRLTSLKRPLGIQSDKLSEWARLGYVPTAIRCNPTGTREKSTQFGTWYLDPKVARKLIADCRAGRPMPWWGKPEPTNLVITWRLYQQRRHPGTCATCRDIWGPAGAPVTYDDYCRRYPPIALGAKRHLTFVYSAGLTLDEVARDARVSRATVQRAVGSGALRTTRHGARFYVTRTDATRWKGRRCPTGENPKSWMSLASARKTHGFTRAELRRAIADGRLQSQVGTNGPMRGVTYVLKQQVREWREAVGFTETEAARRVGVSVARLRTLLRGLEWRPAERIPLDVVSAARRRVDSAPGLTFAQAARQLGKSVTWLRAEMAAGTFRPLRTKWNRRRLYVSAPMFRRLRAAARRKRPVRLSMEWLSQGEATDLAGVSAATLQRWAISERSVRWRHSPIGRRFHRRSVKARARAYWQTARWKRDVAPAWCARRAA